MREPRVTGRSGDGTAIPPASNLRECNHFDRDGDSGRRAARDGVHPPSACFDDISALAGVAWALAGSEIWVAAQRVMPGWVRGRMNSFQIVLGQGSIAVGAVLWGTGVAYAGLDLTFAAAALVALAGLALGYRFSINFATEASVEAAPLNHLHDFPVVPKHDDGPIRITIEYAIARRGSRAVSNFDARSSGYNSAERRVPVRARRKFGSARFVPSGIPGIHVG